MLCEQREITRVYSYLLDIGEVSSETWVMKDSKRHAGVIGCDVKLKGRASVWVSVSQGLK